MVVDDNVQAAQSLARIVKLWGYDSRVAYHGPEALSILSAYRPDVVLLDIGLPGMDGYAVASALRRDPNLIHLSLVAMTGHGGDDVRRRSAEAGFDRHLQKPVDLDLLKSFLADTARSFQGP